VLSESGACEDLTAPAIEQGTGVRLLSVAGACGGLAGLVLLALWLQNASLLAAQPGSTSRRAGG
jgi:hypothetical protein